MSQSGRIQSFDPILGPGARILILGSMPGIASLEAGRYYAHPRNAFWPIMGDLFGAYPDLPYEDRRSILIERGVAVWDVLKHCNREGSLDSNIQNEVPNDFEAFFAQNAGIERVVLNGGKAARSFNRYVRIDHPTFSVHPAPSTSPAYAAITPTKKRELWRSATFD